MNETEIYKSAVDLWGEALQHLMLIEECAELISSLCKQFRGRVDSSKVIEEAVDVQLMINQLKYMLNDNDEWNKQMRYKLDRLESIIKGVDNANR